MATDFSRLVISRPPRRSAKTDLFIYLFFYIYPERPNFFFKFGKPELAKRPPVSGNVGITKSDTFYFIF